jgi:tetratricopeptide (TPR) repeat protein
MLTMRSRTLAFPFLLTLLFAQIVPPVAESQQAAVTESRQTFRTYPFSDPDPIARMSNIYPYFRFEGYSLHPADREWNIVTLENPYIKVLVAPEMGGKILGAFEKSSGKAFIYFNHVVKFRQIAMRGPWTSGGIEINFGAIGHAPTTATPVDYLTKMNEDGSVSCIVGAIDLPSRTQWTVEIRLPADKAYFETRSQWSNPTELSTSLYHWMNTAIDAGADLHFDYPGTSYIDHGGGAYPWPIDNSGRDLSDYKNNAFGSSKSYHVLGTYTDFFGGYWADQDFGSVHWSRYTDKPGKKLWIWAESGEGEIWKDLLTDPELGNKQYVEIQSGLLFNQAGGGSSRTPFKHEFFPPQSEERFVDAWFPTTKIGGLVEANLSGSLNVQRQGDSLKVGFCPLETINDDLVIRVQGRTIQTRRLTLHPLEVFTGTFEVPAEGDVEVAVGDRISYRSSGEEALRLHRPIAANKEFDWTSAVGLYTEGAERAKQRDYKGALDKYLACLSKDPLYTPALVGAAEIYYRRMEPTKALEYVSRALANDTYDPDANFVYGSVNRALGRLSDAKDAFGLAARSMKYRAAASVELAEISFLQKDWDEAEDAALRGLDYDRYNVGAYRLLGVLYRTRGRHDDARIALDALLRVNPLSHLASFERYLLDPSTKALDNFKSLIRNELPQETYLELASYYRRVGEMRDAIKVLEVAPQHPVVEYWLAYLSEKVGDSLKSQGHLSEALRLSPHLVFPFRPETAEAIARAETKRPSWKSKYYLALLFWSKDRIERAQELFSACGGEPDYAPFYLTRGNFRRAEHPELALKDYRKALTLSGGDWREYHVLADYYNEHGDHPGAQEISRSGLAKMPSSYVLQFDLAKSLLFSGRFGASAAILDTITILPFEGARYGRETYRQAYVLFAAEAMKAGKFPDAIRRLDKAREWPERLGVGRPYDVDNRLEDYLQAVSAQALGDKSEAAKLFGQIVQYSEDHADDRTPNRLIGALALRALGKKAEAKKMMDAWIRRDPRSLAVRWSRLVFSRQWSKARELEQEMRKGFAGSLLGKPSIDPNLGLLVEVAKMVEL